MAWRIVKICSGVWKLLTATDWINYNFKIMIFRSIILILVIIFIGIQYKFRYIFSFQYLQFFWCQLEKTWTLFSDLLTALQSGGWIICNIKRAIFVNKSMIVDLLWSQLYKCQVINQLSFTLKCIILNYLVYFLLFVQDVKKHNSRIVEWAGVIDVRLILYFE